MRKKELPMENERSNETRREMLEEIDQSARIEVTEWEADFIDSILRQQKWTPRQISVIDRILDNYLPY